MASVILMWITIPTGRFPDLIGSLRRRSERWPWEGAKHPHHLALFYTLKDTWYFMPEKRVARMSGMPEHVTTSPYDFSARLQAMHNDPRFAGMTDAEMRAFLKEEQAEGMHPSLQGKRF